MEKIIYYKDELNDEFSGSKIIPRVIDENYKYEHKNIFWKIASWILINIITIPIKYLYPKIKFNIKYVGKEKIAQYKNQGYFIYSNHTQNFADTFITSNHIFPKRNSFIVNSENVSMKFLGNSVQMLGAIPIPSTINATKNFLEKIKLEIKKGNSITIFPEAHIWPYYTEIRNFKSVSFKYPVMFKCPVFCVTNTYQEYNGRKNKFRIVSYIDGPFFPNYNLSKKEQQNDLRNKVYNCMVDRSKKSNVQIIKYIKAEKG